MQQPTTSATTMESPDRQSLTPRKSLDAVMTEVFLNVDGCDVHRLLPFIRRLLHQFRLTSFHDECEIVIEAYHRAIKTIESGDPIRNIPAWFKSTSYNIVREWSKQKLKQVWLCDRLQTTSEVMFHPEDMGFNHAIGQNLEWLQRSLQSLDREQELILTLRIVKGLPWKEVAEYFVKENLAEKNDRQLQARLRQEGCRLLKSLRKDYYSCIPQ